MVNMKIASRVQRKLLLYLAILGLVFIFMLLYGKTLISLGSDFSNTAELQNAEELTHLDQKDPTLIEYVRSRFITPPSKLPYDLKHASNPVPSNWYAEFVSKVVGIGRNGTFLEVGAYDGEVSTTLYLEKELGWSGILIECNPKMIPVLRSTNRKSWIAGVCLAPSSSPGILNYTVPENWPSSGTLRNDRDKSAKLKVPMKTEWKTTAVITIPLFTIIAAVGMTEIDVIDLDIEGMELPVLETFPFDLVKFKTISVETNYYKPEEIIRLNNLMSKNGYHLVMNGKLENFYVRESLKDVAQKYLLVKV